MSNYEIISDSMSPAYAAQTRARQLAIFAVLTAALFSMPVVSAATPAKFPATPASIASERSTPARAAVEAQIARIARTSGGEVGVLAHHLESGLTLSLNADESFPMASTFKVAVAGKLLTEIDAGRLSLELQPGAVIYWLPGGRVGAFFRWVGAMAGPHLQGPVQHRPPLPISSVFPYQLDTYRRRFKSGAAGAV